MSSTPRKGNCRTVGPTALTVHDIAGRAGVVVWRNALGPPTCYPASPSLPRDRRACVRAAAATHAKPKAAASPDSRFRSTEAHQRPQGRALARHDAPPPSSPSQHRISQRGEDAHRSSRTSSAMMFRAPAISEKEFIKLVKQRAAQRLHTLRHELLPGRAVARSRRFWAKADRMRGWRTLESQEPAGRRENEVRVNVINQPYGSFRQIADGRARAISAQLLRRHGAPRRRDGRQ